MDFWIKTYSILDRCLYINKYHKEPLYYIYIYISYLDQNKYSYIELGIYEDILCTIEIYIIICKNICLK